MLSALRVMVFAALAIAAGAQVVAAPPDRVCDRVEGREARIEAVGRVLHPAQTSGATFTRSRS